MLDRDDHTGEWSCDRKLGWPWHRAIIAHDRRRGSDRERADYGGDMASWQDVHRLALALPETEERIKRELRQWWVKDKLFVWERPLRPKEIEELGEDAPDGPILGARVEHLVAKEALLANDPKMFFTTPHFDGYAAILVRLDHIAVADLEELVTEAWLARAPKRLAQAYSSQPR
jgi:hypothetical protein